MSPIPSLDSLVADATSSLASVTTAAELQQLQSKYLGKSGPIQAAFAQLKTVAADDRKAVGQSLNEVKHALEALFEKASTAMATAALQQKLAAESADLTLPARGTALGSIHPITQTMMEVIAIFNELGFDYVEGPDVDDEDHNFSALNIPPLHPARQMHDTFYFDADGDNRRLLRTHTSNVQVREMRTRTPPFRFISIGRCYRCDSDQTHSPMFHQIEGVYIDKAVHMGHLKGCIEHFLSRFFEVDHAPIRLRPSYFPFTLPSAEVDVQCERGKDAITIGKGTDWLEILGCGMVHPDVLRQAGIDPDIYQGFAFGMGIERIAMLKYRIPDLRILFEGQVSWMNHHSFPPYLMPVL